MLSSLTEYLDISHFMPHGMCYMWREDLLLLQVGSDALIAAAYFTIPAALLTFIRRRGDVPNDYIVKMFIAFILLCGVTHAWSIVVVWTPAYYAHGFIKLATALVSIATAIMLWRLIPVALKLPGVQQMEERNREIEALNRRLQQRLDSLSTLAGGVAHEFNNTLTIIQGHNELMSLGREFRDDSVRAIADATERMQKTCQAMQAYSGRGHFVMTEVALNDCVEEALSTQDGDIEISFEPGDLPVIQGESRQLVQMIDSLVANAVEACRAEDASQATVTVSTRLETLSPEQLAEASVDGGMLPGEAVILEVKDTGEGMSPEVRERALEPYFTTRFTGRGLGLAAVQGTVRGHGGVMFLASVEGQHTSIRIAFPVTGATSSQLDGLRAASLSTVLVVDDEPEVLALAQRYLGDMGLRVLTSDSARQAIELYRGQAADIDAVVVDYLMPEMSGVQLLERFQSVAPVESWLSSGYSRGEIADPAQYVDLAGFIAKPFDRADFERFFRDRVRR